MPFTTLISTQELARHLDDPSWIVFDCRHDLANPGAGRRAYLGSHIPGAFFLHLDEDLSGPLTGRNGRHPLPDPRRFAARLGELGAGGAKQVAAYDAGAGMMAARLWWLLRWLGHEQVAVLDGGYARWLKEGRPETGAVPEARPCRFPGFPRSDGVADAATVARHLGNPAVRLVDARAPERFKGLEETLDPVAGHIPGAINRFFKDNLDAEGCFRAADVLRNEFQELLAGASSGQVVHYCGSGVTACHNLLAMEIAGLSGSRMYPGSWSEWCSDPSRPVAR
ncbi:MAG: sulfurtransferase [Betaproteobacteria bacterium]|nr:sulfurtransferase [Betaproteobacteria bacterium]